MSVPDEYDDWNVHEVASNATEVDDPDVLAEWLEYEEDNKDRKTAKSAIKERFAVVEGSQDPDDAEADQEASDGDEDEPENGRFARIRNPERKSKHAAGYSWSAGEVKKIRTDAKVKKALRDGELQYVG